MRLIVFSLLVHILLAQPGRAGILNGVLQDSLSGQGVAGVQLICLGTGNGKRHLTRTDDQGHFAFNDLPEDTYWLAAAHSGYISKRIENVAVPGIGAVRQDLLLVRKPEGQLDAIPLSAGDAALLGPPRSQELARNDNRPARKGSARSSMRSWDDLKLRVYGWLMDKVGSGSTNER